MTKRGLVLITLLLACAVGGIGLYLRLTRPSLPERPFVDQLLGESSVKVQPPDRIELILVGDIMLSRNVGAAIRKSGDPNLPFAKLKNYLASSALNFGNLESPFSGSDFLPQTGNLVFNVPSAYIKGLAENNFRVLSLANNHTLDQGAQGLSFTQALLANNNITGVGAGNDLEQAWAPAELTIKNTKLCFLATSYASANDGGKSRNDYVARTDNLDRLRTSLAQMKTDGCEIIIASMHAGTEYTRTPNKTQTGFARAAIDFGADVVVGSHPHWVQPIERYGKGLIFYSLGNFIFDQEWSKATKQGLTVKLTIEGKRLISAELVPITIENYCCARLADENESREILNDINATSTEIKL
ncbi:MAG: CapA family protein [Patescibacteria group bacterium]|nr:CapA family protein [Patescibacteria group bacterium]